MILTQCSSMLCVQWNYLQKIRWKELVYVYIFLRFDYTGEVLFYLFFVYLSRRPWSSLKWFYSKGKDLFLCNQIPPF